MKLAKEGRTFTCEGCPKGTQRKRRCREEREDFTSADDPIFPIYINKGGELYGFCPAKATWDQGLVREFKEMVVIAETRVMPRTGGLNEQDADTIEKLSWFLPRYDFMKFLSKADAILGDSDKLKKAQAVPKQQQNMTKRK